MASIIIGRYEPPASIVQGYPHALSIIVMRALATEAEDRYASAEHMRQALEEYLRSSGPQVGAAQVAALVRERCGDDLEARAAALRSGAPLTPSGQPARWAPTQQQQKSPVDSGSGAMMIDGRPAQPRPSVLWVAIAALLGASLGVAVLSYVRAIRRAKLTVTAAADAPPSTPLTVSTTGALTPGASVRTSTDQPAIASPRGRVHLRITPSTALVLVDGVLLPPGTDTVAKPPRGVTVNVLVRADKHEDTVVMVDAATPDEVEVTLVPNAPIGASGSASAPPAATATATATSRPRGGSSAAKDGGAPGLDTPPNPYD
jgi:hypothetical protein